MTALLLAPFFCLSAQTTPPAPLVFESVSFSTVQGSITINCTNAEQLTKFEFIGTDSYYVFEWDSEHPTKYFPMKLALKPGKVVVRYKMRGEKDKIIELKIEANDDVKLTL